MVVIFIIVLLLFGPKKLPDLARGFGKAMGEFKKAREEFEREITHAVNQAETQAMTHEPVSADISHDHQSSVPDSSHDHQSSVPDSSHEHLSSAPDSADVHQSAPDVGKEHGIREPAGKEPYAS